MPVLLTEYPCDRLSVIIISIPNLLMSTNIVGVDEFYYCSKYLLVTLKIALLVTKTLEAMDSEFLILFYIFK